MKFAQEKRRLLGWLALVAPLPLPLNEPRPTGVVVWPVVILWVALMILFLRRVERGHENWLSNRALNLLGLAYIPLLVIDVASSAGLAIRPMMHLALFALAAKLFSLQRERDKWHALLGIFFVFVTSTATSTSLGIVVYLVVFMAMAGSVLSRFSSLHMESFEDVPSVDQLSRLGPRLLPAVVALAIPIFLLMPRFGTPFLFGESGGRSITGTGFSDEVRLDGIGRIRTSSEVALRINFAAPQPPRPLIESLRLRGATYDVYQGDGWEQSASARPIRVGDSGVVAMGDQRNLTTPSVASAQIWLEPIDARALILPNRSLRLLTDYRGPIQRNVAGALSFFQPPRSVVSYRVELGAEDTVWASAPSAQDASLDPAGVSERIRQLARTVAGEGSALERAARIEAHLQNEYDYELELLGAGGDGAIERFLFEQQAGHCEYFASAMVLMLRAEGIPARFVTGFLGTETSPLGYSIVRQSNAHAWVEAYDSRTGWTVFDPTPPAGRPTAAGQSVLSLFRQAYDWAVFSWDRYILGFGTGEQRQVIGGLIDWLRSLFAGDEPSSESNPQPRDPTAESPIETPLPDSLGDRFQWGRSTVVLLLLTAVAALLWWRRQSRVSAAANYLRLRAAARKAGIEGGSSPLEFVRKVAQRVPEAEEPARRAVVLYLEDSFSPNRLEADELARCRDQTREAVRCLKRARSRPFSQRSRERPSRRSSQGSPAA